MKLDLARPTLCALMAVASVAAAPNPPASTKDDIAATVRALGDESFVEREKATRDLWKIGDAAVAELRRVSDGDDPEAALRARGLLRKIELGILPDSSPRLVELVMRYDRGGIDERRVVIREMKAQRAWRQILKLFALEEDQASRKMLEIATRGVAIEAAREALSSNPPDIRGAFSYLELAPREPRELMAMASLHRATGNLDRELERADKDDPAWRYALLATAGRLDEAAVAAEEAGLSMAAARLQLLAGDPVPWMTLAQPGGQSIPALGLATYREIAIDTWEGRPVKAEKLLQLRRFVRGGNEDEKGKDLRLMFLAGENEEAEKLLVDLDPKAAFFYFEETERIEEALAVFDLDPEKPDYTGWAMKRFRVLIDEPDREDDEIPQLSLMGYFLERHGLVQELDAAFTPPLVELAGKDQESFIRVCARLFNGGVDGIATPTALPVVKAVAAYAGDDELRWLHAVKNLFDRMESPDQLWDWLGKLEPELDRPQRLERLCQILPFRPNMSASSGFLPDPNDERGKFLKKAWAEIETADGVEKARLTDLFTDLSRAVNDAENFLRGVEAIEADLAAQNREDPWPKGFTGNELAAVGRWADSAVAWLQVVERYPSEPIFHAVAAAALRKSGSIEAADEHEKAASLLALGETSTLDECGDVFAKAGDFDRAWIWWNRAAAECSRELPVFYDVVDKIYEGAMWKSDWKLAAPLIEAHAFLQALSADDPYRIPVTYRVDDAIKSRVEANLVRAFSKLDTDRDRSLKVIERCSTMPWSENVLADYFFPLMREKGLVKLHDQAFEFHWRKLVKEIERFPACDNTRNSAAWLASRANRRLDEAEAYLKEALVNAPRQAAYLDTMAELHFARGDRKRAVEFSNRSLAEMPPVVFLRQNQRFVSGPLPPK
ncbi:hypothetical protein [Luteolibacter marinus]|uniref:hypothetical protein n=1 Tax=Luteolibacter marinus TaxID=2776705 RepID=UPI0018671A87|nr:hypothetical protein [Luteolibacter marinus]